MYMKVAQFISEKIKKMPVGLVFTQSSFELDKAKREAVIKALNRLVEAGEIEKLAKGKFYKPEVTVFGKLKPSSDEILKDLIEEKGCAKGYLTGYSIFNKLGLTTQVSNAIQIGRNDFRPPLSRDFYSITFVKQKNKITAASIPLLQILDSIRFIKKVPDASLSSCCYRLLDILSNLSSQEQSALVQLAFQYNPATRALVGAMFDQLNKEELTFSLLKTLNPITTYKFEGLQKALITTNKWNIK